MEVLFFFVNKCSSKRNRMLFYLFLSMDLGGGFHCASQKTREHFYFLVYWPITFKFSEPQTNYRCCLPASHDPHVMEIYGIDSRLLAIMPSNPNAVFPCLKKEVRSTEKRSIAEYISWRIVRTHRNLFQALLLPLRLLSVSQFCILIHSQSRMITNYVLFPCHSGPR